MTVYCHMTTLSFRRTTSHDVSHPEGLDGPMAARCHGRDLLLEGDGTEVLVTEVSIDARAGFDDGKISRLVTDAPDLDLSPLVGTSAFSGFRKATREHGAPALVLQLLDDLPIAFMLNGRVLRLEGIPLGKRGRRLPVDLCAGWAEGGSLLAGHDEVLGPPIHAGPVVPLEDPLAWPTAEPRPPRSTGRRRRFDVTADAERATVDGRFRDTHTDAEGVETVVHEYAFHVVMDRTTRRFVRSEATPGPLPYLECPAAAPSATRLVGEPVDGVRDRVSASFTGPSTCTHLNDALRSLEDVLDTLAVLDESQRHDGARRTHLEEGS